MKFTATLLTLLTASFALPAEDTEAGPRLFSLVTKTNVKAFNGLCVEGYHTGAGTADAVLTQCTSNSRVYFLNGTAIHTTQYGKNIDAGVQIVDGEVTYDEWAPVTVNAIAPPTKGLTYSSEYGFSQPKALGGYGFIACEWAHGGSKQLFALSQKNSATKVISTCALVGLLKG